MFLEKLSPSLWRAALVLTVGAYGCMADPSGPSADGGLPGADGGVVVGPDGSVVVVPDGSVVETQLPESEKARLQFKRQRRLAADFSAALELPRADLCKELDRYDCFDVVHNITLGGVDAYNLGIFEPLAETTKTTPISVERIALTACRNRVDLDLADPAGAVIFKDLPVAESGALSDPSAPEVEAAIDGLYRRFVLRRAEAEEISEIRGFHAAVLDSGDAQAARSWAILACFMVSTGVESIFY